MSQDIFQLEMNRILEKGTGVCGIADDFVMYGATEAEHDRNLLQFMDVAKQHGLTLNSAKCDIEPSPFRPLLLLDVSILTRATHGLLS